MSARVQALNLAGKKFVVLERGEYERLRALDREAVEAGLPPWPPADRKGNRPALEFVRVSIARDIIKERKALGLTQEQLAKLAGIRQETLCRLETGKQAPNVRTVDKIDQALKRAARQQAATSQKLKKNTKKGKK
jgi:DNA-binding XRE family transcriptional regulator